MMKSMLTTALLMVTTPVASEPLIDRIEKAVQSGSVRTLIRSRGWLKAHIGREQVGPSDRYLLAYTDWRITMLLANHSKAVERKSTLLKEAERHLEAILEAEPDHAEALALLGTVLGARIQGNVFRAMTLGPRSSRTLDRAVELAPKNPRVALLRGVSYFFTPEMAGGGLDKAKQELDRAHALFSNQTQKPPWPHWGRTDTYAWRGQVEAKAGRKDAARAIYREALTIEPGSVWIRDILLPTVE